MKKKLMNKFTLKILSFVIAVLIWFLVVSIDDPVITQSYHDIPVTIVNDSYLASNFQVPMLVEGRDTVNVKIRAKRKVINTLKKENITAEADMTQIISMDTEPYMVPVKVNCPGVDEDMITVSPANIPIETDEQISVEKTVAVNYGESMPDKNYEVGSVKAVPEKVTLIGPSTLVNKIDKVVAKIDVSDMTEAQVLEADLKIYDKNQDELSEKQLEYLDLKEISDNKVKVQVDLWKVKNNVAIEAAYSGEPKYGYEVSGLSPVPDTITVAGTDEALQALEEAGNTLKIPGNMIDVSGQSQDFEETVDISELLPENIQLARDINSSVIVTVKILPYNSKEYEIPAESIEVSSKPKDMSVVFGEEKVTVRVKGKEADLNKLNADKISLKLDLKDSEEGEQEVQVAVSLPEGYELVDEVKVKIKIVPSATKQEG